jgi:hypothetical protein
MRLAAIALITSLLLALGGSVATAQTPSTRGYDETLGVIGEIETQQPNRDPDPEPTPTPTPTPEPEPTPQPQQQEESGSLPFTGLDVGIVALMGLALLGTGLALRRSAGRSRA